MSPGRKWLEFGANLRPLEVYLGAMKGEPPEVSVSQHGGSLEVLVAILDRGPVCVSHGCLAYTLTDSPTRLPAGLPQGI